MQHDNRRGFTFVELMTAMALLAVLTAIAWGRFNESYEHALKATLVSDIRNLATAQELYFREHSAYTTNTDALNVNPSAKSTIYVTEAGPAGWAAWNEMERTTWRCEMYVGNGTSPLGIADSSEQLKCDRL